MQRYRESDDVGEKRERGKCYIVAGKTIASEKSAAPRCIAGPYYNVQGILFLSFFFLRYVMSALSSPLHQERAQKKKKKEEKTVIYLPLKLRKKLCQIYLYNTLCTPMPTLFFFFFSLSRRAIALVSVEYMYRYMYMQGVLDTMTMANRFFNSPSK